MAQTKTSASNHMLVFLSVGLLLLSIVVAYITMTIFGWKTGIQHNIETKYTFDKSCPRGKVCLNEEEYERMLKRQRDAMEERVNLTRERDLRVLRDPLYPALNRTHAVVYEDVAELTRKRLINQPTSRGYDRNDTYRMIGYMVNEEDPTCKQWKLFGRTKDRNKGEFFMTPVDKTLDMKIQITDDMMKSGDKLRSLDDIPSEVSLTTPLLSETPYKFIELPKSDFSDEYT